MSRTPNAQLHPKQPPVPAALNRVLEVINASDDNVLAQLSVLSDDQLINDTHLHLALLLQPDTLIRLLELKDLYVQFAAYKLVKAILLNSNIYSLNSATSPSSNLLNNRQQAIRILVQKLIHIDQNSSGTGRAILELFHGLLKDHRNLIRNLDQHNHDGNQSSSTSSLTEEDEGKAAKVEVLVISQHAAVTVIQELGKSEFWGATVLDLILSLWEMQYAALVLFIDLQKARLSVMDSVNGVGDEFRDIVMVCHKKLVHHIDKWMSSDRIGSLPLKKYLELICISMRPTPSLTPRQHQQQCEEGSMEDQETALRRPLEVLTALSPIILDVLRAFQELDPDLDDFSSGRTTFILPDNRNILVRDFTPTETFATTRARTKALLLSNPEAIRQLGRVCLTAAILILDTLASTSSSTDGNDDFYCHIAELTNTYLIPFLEEWVGERTLPLLLAVYGEDDTGVSWLLKTMSRIYRRILDLLPLSSRHHHHQQRQHVEKIHSLLLENHVHPLEALFYFLGTIGFDYQTLLDLLLTLDDPNESGGMLAAVMTILRSFTEDVSDQERVLRRWRQEILHDQQLQLMQLQQSHDTDGEGCATDSDYNSESQLQQPRLEVLSNAYDCLDQLSHQIQRLYRSNLFPYNPRPLLHVLELTKDILSTLLNDP